MGGEAKYKMNNPTNLNELYQQYDKLAKEITARKKLKVVYLDERPKFINILHMGTGGLCALDENGTVWIRWNTHSGKLDPLGGQETAWIALEDIRIRMEESIIEMVQ